VAIVSTDAAGVRLVHLVGGTQLTVGEVSVTTVKAEHMSAVSQATYAKRVVTLSQPLPAQLLDGEMLTIGNATHRTAFHTLSVSGSKVQLERSSKTYAAGVESVNVAAGYAVLDLAPYLVSYHPGYYNGMTAVNEKGQAVGRVELGVGERYWYTGWPAVRRHLARIRPEDVTDANGDGRRTVTMICREKTAKFAPDGETVVPVNPGDEMLELEITRIREDGLMLWTKQHSRIFLDSLNVPHPGWPYHHQTIRNEKGDREWIVNMPGDTYQLRVDGRKLTENDFPDVDGDGRRTVEFHHYGPGDTVTVPTHVYLRRIGKATYELRANVACTVSIPGTGAELSVDNGRTWTELDTQTTVGRVTMALTESVLGSGVVRLRTAP